ncbi:hypothetical protein Q5Z23_37090, partial [Pseudomonas aeruginosa]|uniref:hypothetical protein n=1 Tax=Pseudomonas aeruginosa TaxID=287 RepID=UPI002713B78E
FSLARHRAGFFSFAGSAPRVAGYPPLVGRKGNAAQGTNGRGMKLRVASAGSDRFEADSRVRPSAIRAGQRKMNLATNITNKA